MGTISNWGKQSGLWALSFSLTSRTGNLPTAVVQTLAKSAPFDPDTDVELGIAYIA